MISGPDQRLIIFARRPFPGVVKTRLAADLGQEQAAGVYARLLYAYLIDLLDCDRSSFRVELCLSRAGDVPFFAAAFPEFIVSHQVQGDLGVRMRTAFDSAFAAGAKRVVLTGSDVPDLGSDNVAEAFEALRQAPLVISPSDDGGYALIGLQAPGAPLFEGIAWSTERVLAETEAIAAPLSGPIFRLPALYDIDTIHYFERWRRRLLRVE